MDEDSKAYATTRLHQLDLDERATGLEQALVLAAEAHHRQCLLAGDKPRLEDLACEWIELLRVSSRKTAG